MGEEGVASGEVWGLYQAYEGMIAGCVVLNVISLDIWQAKCQMSRCLR
jgi:hypothetical protein